MWPAAHFRAYSAVQIGLILSSWKQLNTATPKPGCFWHAGGLNGIHVGPGWGNVQCIHLPRWTARGAQLAPVAWPPFAFGRYLAAQCWASTYVLLFQSHADPPGEGPACSKRDLPSQWTAVGLSMLQLWGPIHFRAQITARFRVISMCTCRPQGCCYREWGGGLSGELVIAQLLPDPRHEPCGCHLSTHVHFVMCHVPPRHVARAGSQN
jgi:hypothetical protein